VSVTPSELELLEHSQRYRTDVELVVDRCLFSCCGKGWRERADYEQTYHGYVDRLDGDEDSAFMLYSRGLGTLSYIVRMKLADVHEVRPVLLPEPRMT
jgi:hypothetical protein